MNRLLILIFFFAVFSGCQTNKEPEITSFVNPFIGSDGHGHTFPGATLPFGMVQLSPDTRKDSWDGCSGYHYSDKTILGFSHTHLSGTGVGDYGDIRLVPITGELKINPGNENEPGSGYRSKFSHKDEIATPGYYKVFLEDYKISAALTVTKRCGFHKYTFPDNSSSFIIIDLTESVTSDKIAGSELQFYSDTEIGGYRRTKGWAKDQVIYFYAILSKPFDSYGIAKEQQILEGQRESKGSDIKGFVKYSTKKDEEILVKVGISAVSVHGDKNNPLPENQGWDFDQVASQASQTWNDQLSKIRVKGGTAEDKVKFYTAYYHSCIAPNLFTDADRKYRGHDGEIHTAEKFDVYTVFSLWDTYRALHPLMTILEPSRTVDFIKTFVDIYEKSGLLPIWELAGNETFCMIGYHSVPVIVDAYIKGIRGFDAEKAFEAMKSSSLQDHFGLSSYRKYGFVPAEDEGESISKTLEYSYDDWCIAQMAKALGKEEDYKEYICRAQYYKNLFDPETRFIRGKRNGMFTEPFEPSEVNFMLTEANTWQYTFYVPQDIKGFKELMGDDAGFTSKLDEMFSISSKLRGREQADITGLIGQYAHGNEPSHHMAYLYNFSGEAYKTQKLTRQIMNELYGAGSDGLCGNEDCGQMSAWFVLSALGFYPVTPGEDYYVIGSPIFEEAEIHLENGKIFKISAETNSHENIYIQHAELNGKPYDLSYLKHEEIMNGGELKLAMSDKPNKEWGRSPESRPVTEITDYLITPVPFFNVHSATFKDNQDILIGNIYPEAMIRFAEGENLPNDISLIYSNPFHVTSSAIIYSYAEFKPFLPSKTVVARFHQIHNDWSVQVKNEYSPQYTGGGPLALINGQLGGANFRTGSWQGYHGVDLEVIIDLGKSQPVNCVSARFLEDQNSWIFLPASVEYAIAVKPGEFKTIAVVKNELIAGQDEPNIKVMSQKFDKLNGRFIKVTAKNIGKCPEWHVGAGDKAWIFIDEITIE